MEKAKIQFYNITNNKNYYKKQIYYLVIYFDTPNLISECNNNYFHNVDKMRKVSDAVHFVCEKYKLKIPILSTSEEIYMSSSGKQYIKVSVEMYIKFTMCRKDVVDLFNSLCLSIESYEHNLANWLAKRKKKDLPYPNPRENITHYEYKKLPWEGRENPPDSEQLTLNLESKKYCPSPSFFLKD